MWSSSASSNRNQGNGGGHIVAANGVGRSELEADTHAFGAILIANVAWSRVAIAPVLVKVGAEQVCRVQHHRNVLVDVIAERQVDLICRFDLVVYTGNGG